MAEMCGCGSPTAAPSCRSPQGPFGACLLDLVAELDWKPLEPEQSTVFVSLGPHIDMLSHINSTY